MKAASAPLARDSRRKRQTSAPFSPNFCRRNQDFGIAYKQAEQFTQCAEMSERREQPKSSELQAHEEVENDETSSKMQLH